MRNKSLMRLAVCLIGMAAMVLQGCSESGTDRDKLCGSWSSVEGKPDVLVYNCLLYTSPSPRDRG